ncbi:hypothetical protein DL96DRAFT_1558094 [Flagelloscypha sp. PMI_526]|nr:hypothetical protein DL96DRAFT_1558094 [Flagelloscypha sp. PMI_526]
MLAELVWTVDKQDEVSARALGQLVANAVVKYDSALAAAAYGRLDIVKFLLFECTMNWELPLSRGYPLAFKAGIVGQNAPTYFIKHVEVIQFLEAIRADKRRGGGANMSITYRTNI